MRPAAGPDQPAGAAAGRPGREVPRDQQQLRAQQGRPGHAEGEFSAVVGRGTLQKDTKSIADLRSRLEKIEEINEILLGEYKKASGLLAGCARVRACRWRRSGTCSRPVCAGSSRAKTHSCPGRRSSANSSTTSVDGTAECRSADYESAECDRRYRSARNGPSTVVAASSSVQRSARHCLRLFMRVYGVIY